MVYQQALTRISLPRGNIDLLNDAIIGYAGSDMRLKSNIAFFVVAIMAVALAGAHSARAQVTGSYITPFPNGGTYKIYVFGDSLGNGIWSGLYGAFRGDASVRVVKKSKAASGFVRNASYDWNKVIARITGSEDFDIAVAMFGANDRQKMRINKRRYSVGSREWRTEYGQRVDRFMKVLKSKKIALYWVGLPIMRSKLTNEAMQIINQIVREKAYLNGVKFIDTWNGFTDQDGGYSPFGPDLAGRIKKLRVGDGVHFTPTGYRKLAHYVEREIRRDISVAKAERSIPLAGDLAEQRRIIRRRPQQAVSRQSTDQIGGDQAGADRAGGKGAAQRRPARVRTSRRRVSAREYGADNSKIVISRSPTGGSGKGQVIKILRPAIPPAVVNHILSRVSSLRASNVGEAVIGHIDGGLIAMSSITPVSRQAGVIAKRNVPLTQTPYYRVLIKGVVLPPKPGRADDFRWVESGQKPSG